MRLHSEDLAKKELNSLLRWDLKHRGTEITEEEMEVRLRVLCASVFSSFHEGVIKGGGTLFGRQSAVDVA